MPETETYGRTETERAESAKQIMTHWPAVPSTEELELTLARDQFIRENAASPRGKDLVTFPDPYGRQAFLDLSPLMLPDVTFKNPAVAAAVHALWTVEHSKHFHEAIFQLFTTLDMNNVHEGAEVPGELAALEPGLRRATAIAEFMHSAAEFATNVHSIGLTWSRTVPEFPGKTAHPFQMLPRNPAWMEFAGQLPLVKDCYFLVCAVAHKTPLHAVGYPATPEALANVSDLNNKFTSAESRTLA